MKTRSTVYEFDNFLSLTMNHYQPSNDMGIYEVNIDFDEAHEAWMKNKKKVGESYAYVCGIVTKNGTYCQNKLYKNCNYCYIHRKN